MFCFSITIESLGHGDGVEWQWAEREPPFSEAAALADDYTDCFRHPAHGPSGEARASADSIAFRSWNRRIAASPQSEFAPWHRDVPLSSLDNKGGYGVEILFYPPNSRSPGFSSVHFPTLRFTLPCAQLMQLST